MAWRRPFEVDGINYDTLRAEASVGEVRAMFEFINDWDDSYLCPVARMPCHVTVDEDVWLARGLVWSTDGEWLGC